MEKRLIWDLPTRVMHWMLAIGFCGAFLLAILGEDNHRVFPYHMLFGLAVLPVVLFRIVWGIVGTKYARFTSFFHSPNIIVQYVTSTIRKQAKRYPGHNPAASYVMLAIILLIGLNATTGILLVNGYWGLEDIHPVIAYILLGLIGLHIVGLITHTIQHREAIALSMITGKKQTEETIVIPSRQRIGLAIEVILLLFAGLLWTNYHPRTRQVRIPLTSIVLTLGETAEKSQFELEQEGD